MHYRAIGLFITILSSFFFLYYTFIGMATTGVPLPAFASVGLVICNIAGAYMAWAADK